MIRCTTTSKAGGTCYSSGLTGSGSKNVFSSSNLKFLGEKSLPAMYLSVMFMNSLLYASVRVCVKQFQTQAKNNVSQFPASAGANAITHTRLTFQEHGKCFKHDTLCIGPVRPMTSCRLECVTYTISFRKYSKSQGDLKWWCGPSASL